MRTFAAVALMATAISAYETFKDDKKILSFVPTVDGDTLTVEVLSQRTVDDDFTFESLKNQKINKQYIDLYLGFALSNAVRLDGMPTEGNTMSGGVLKEGEWGDSAVARWNANNGSTSMIASNRYEGPTKTGDAANTSWTIGSASCQGKTCSFKFSRPLSGTPEITVNEEYVVTTLTGIVQEGADQADQGDYVKICIGDCTETEVEATQMASTETAATGSGAITNLVATATALAAILMF